MPELETVLEFVAQDLHRRNPRYTLEQAREMVNLARKSVTSNPQKFLDAYLDNVNALAEAKSDA